MSTDTPTWVGAVTVGSTPLDGTIVRVVLQGEQVFALTRGLGKGLQVISVPEMQAQFQTATANGRQSAEYFTMRQQLGLEGGAFGQEAIVSTTFLDTGTGQNSLQADLAIVTAPVEVEAAPQPIAVTTGRRALAIVNPQTSEVLYSGPVVTADQTVVFEVGQYVAAGLIGTRPIALVGSAVARKLSVVDLTDPHHPTALATIDLPPGVLDTWTRIVLRDGVAYLGGSAGTTIVNVADPRQPRITGTLPGLGGFAALGAHHPFLLSASHFYAPETHGLQATVLQRWAYVVAVPPRITRIVTPATPQRELVQPLELVVRSVPAAPGGTASVVLSAGGAVATASLAPLAPTGFRGEIPAGLLVPTATTVLQATPVVTLADGEVLPTAPTPIRLGDVRWQVDANNDLVLDTQDDTARDQGKVWAFWEADPRQLSSVPPAPLGAAGVNDGDPDVRKPTVDGLTDFATVRLQVTAPAKGLEIRLHGDDADINRETRWSLTPKAGLGLDYLKVATTGEEQRDLAKLECETDRGTLKGRCDATGVTSIRLADVEPGTYEYLFRCESCPTDSTRRLEVEQSAIPLAPIALDVARVDIRPLKGWMSVYTAHPPKPGPLNPRDVAILLNGWSPVPPNRRSVTMLLHGFAVSESGASDFTFPVMAKRLYWAQHPILEPQESSSYVVGFTWPGDVGRIDELNFPDDEFLAFQSSEPFSSLVRELRANGAVEVNALAHSLGNLVVNEAVANSSTTLVDRLVMVDAAVAAEAFTLDYQPTERERNLFERTPFAGAISHGYPNDAIWEDEWKHIVATKDRPRSNLLCDTEAGKDCRSAYQFIVDTYPSQWSDIQRSEAFVIRWRKGAGSSPWRGIFSENPSRMALFNFYNPTDRALNTGVAWSLSQVAQKPVSDNIGDYFWLRLSGASADELPVGWAKLSYYFSALSEAAGQAPLVVLGADRNISFGAVGGSEGLPSYGSHTYVTSTPIWNTAILYKMAREVFGGKLSLP